MTTWIAADDGGIHATIGVEYRPSGQRKHFVDLDAALGAAAALAYTHGQRFTVLPSAVRCHVDATLQRAEGERT
jgi:hypothetical protein